METLKNESELVAKLQKDIENTDKSTIKILAGHLPLVYDCNNHFIELDVRRWGEFSTYTFSLGCRLLRESLDQGKEGKLIVLVDDDYELPKEIKIINGRETYVRKDYSWAKKPRKRFFETAELPEDYSRVMNEYRLSKENISSNNKSLLISERSLKWYAIKNGLTASNECSLAYKALIMNTNFLEIEKDYLVGFIPGQCKGNICEGFLDIVGNKLSSSHVFFPHVESGIDSPENILRRVNSISIEETYQKGNIFYRKN